MKNVCTHALGLLREFAAKLIGKPLKNDDNQDVGTVEKASCTADGRSVTAEIRIHDGTLKSVKVL